MTDLEFSRSDVDALARKLGMSSRTLQRRLTEEGTTFRRLLNEVRRRLATTYLMTPGVGIAEVAFLLGFSDVPAFHRAFRAWTGQAPGAYRQQGAPLA